MKLQRDFILGKNRPGDRIQVQYLTIHETGNTRVGADAVAHRNYAQNNNREVSYHWTVDDKVAIQVLPDTEMAWHAGSTGGNQASVSIEICENKDGDPDTRYRNSTWLAAYLLYKHKLPLTKMVPHQYWSGKNCPRNLLSKWDQFQSDVARQLNLISMEKTHILGTTTVTAQQMRDYLREHHPDAPDYVDLYFRMEQSEGVRADVAFAQSLLETNFFRFTGTVSENQNNFAGLGATGSNEGGLSFSTPMEGIMAQGRHLRLYAKYLPELNDKKVDPRGLPENLMGWAPFVEDLSGKWAVDPDYGSKIVNLLKEMKQTPKEEQYEHWAIPELLKLKQRGIILEDHDPEDNVTFGEVATMLNRVLDIIYRNTNK